jgi:chromosome segregation ATPase
LKEENEKQTSIIRQLKQQVNEGLAERSRLTGIVAEANHEKTRNQRHFNDIWSELQRVRIQLAGFSHSQRSSYRSRNDYGELENARDRYREKYEDAKSDIRDLNNEVKGLKGDKHSLNKRLDVAEDELSDAQARINRQAKTIKDLKAEISALERDRDLKAPILQIGVDVRLRNLEHARDTVLEVSRGELDRAIIMNGNIAAHRANAAVDAAIFQAGLVSDEYMEEAKYVFKRMYQVEPSNYGCWSPKVLRMIDCQATVMSVKAIRRRNASFELREEHSEISDRLLELHTSMGRREFEADEEVDELIEKMELLTTEIVEMDRTRGGKH